MSESENLVSPLLKKSNSKPDRKPKEVWNFFMTTGEKKEGHQGCKCKYCPWSQTRGEPNLMKAHLALSCHKVMNERFNKFEDDKYLLCFFFPQFRGTSPHFQGI